MTATDGPIGPFPTRVGDDETSQDEYDRLRRRVLWTLPYGLYVVGSASGDELNGMALNWATQLAFEPKLIGIGVEHGALTHRLISESGVYTLCTIDREDRAIIRKFTKPVDVDREAKTLNGFPYHLAESGAPVLDQSVAWLDCRVTDSLEFGAHTFFVGEVLDCDFQKDEDTPVLRMEDTRMNYGG
ncbi:MAG: flavin reductase family protein [Actinomycetota bacterium]